MILKIHPVTDFLQKFQILRKPEYFVRRLMKLWTHDVLVACAVSKCFWTKCITFVQSKSICSLY